MRARDEENQTVSIQSKAFFSGTVSSLLGRSIAWQIELLQIEKSQTKPHLSTWQLLQNAATRAECQRMYKIFFTAGLGQTIGRSCAHGGVQMWVQQNEPELSFQNKALKIGAYSTALESLLTFKPEFNKVKTLLNTHAPALTVQHQAKAFSATFARVGWANFLTYSFLFKIEDLLMQFDSTQKNNITRKTMAGMLGAAFAAPLGIIPLNLQSHILNHIEKPMISTTANFFKTRTFREWGAGLNLRVVRNMIIFGITNGLAGVLEKKISEEELSGITQHHSIFQQMLDPANKSRDDVVRGEVEDPASSQRVQQCRI